MHQPESSVHRLGRLILLAVAQAAYERLARPVIFRGAAQTAHEQVLALSRRLDGWLWSPLLGSVGRLSFAGEDVSAGGVTLASPLILAAGFVKGQGFDSEDEALRAVADGQNVIPGWRSIPRLVGPVEFGSFTRWPRRGNDGTVVWRDVPTRSTQNRVGLKNPGAQAAAAFLAQRRAQLSSCFGINVAVSPGVSDPDQEQREVLEALRAFLERDVRPAWFTLNLSCPNTEDDPTGRQTEAGARRLCSAAVDLLGPTPLWVKVGPNLAVEQYRRLMSVFAETGVRAVVATNTMPEPSPENPQVMAGVGGGRLHCRAVDVAALLVQESRRLGSDVDVIGCGGVQDGRTFRAFADIGVRAVQYWTALIYRGPLAAAVIAHEKEGRA